MAQVVLPSRARLSVISHVSVGDEQDARPLDPLLKWPGGKRWLADQVVPMLRATSGRYYEPFLGGAAVYLALLPNRATLSDLNGELINVYQQVRDNPSGLLARLKSLRNSSTAYYKVRDSRPRGKLGRAARLIYLMRLSFNGIHRVNLKGEFNVPYGRKRHLDVCDEDHLYELSQALKGTELLVEDFEVASEGAGEGDAVYFDPPYSVAHGQNGFVKYNERIFSWQDQVRLAAHARKLAARGALVVVSNADHESIRQLYSGFSQKTVGRFSRIAAAGRHRKEVTELLLSLGGSA